MCFYFDENALSIAVLKDTMYMKLAHVLLITTLQVWS